MSGKHLLHSVIGSLVSCPGTDVNCLLMPHPRVDLQDYQQFACLLAMNGSWSKWSDEVRHTLGQLRFRGTVPSTDQSLMTEGGSY